MNTPPQAADHKKVVQPQHRVNQFTDRYEPAPGSCPGAPKKGKRPAEGVADYDRYDDIVCRK